MGVHWVKRKDDNGYIHCMPGDFVEGFEFEVKVSFTETKKFTFTPGMLLDDTDKQKSPTIIDTYRYYPGLFRKKITV